MRFQSLSSLFRYPSRVLVVSVCTTPAWLELFGSSLRARYGDRESLDPWSTFVAFTPFPQPFATVVGCVCALARSRRACVCGVDGVVSENVPSFFFLQQTLAGSAVVQSPDLLRLLRTDYTEHASIAPFCPFPPRHHLQPTGFTFTPCIVLSVSNQLSLDSTPRTTYGPSTALSPGG